jgi:hypothetical protein
MIKNFDNITVKSKYSDNYYDSFRVNTALNEVYFIQRDARRNGQVARCFTVSVNEINNDVLIEAYSADEGRYEQFVRTQCLELALQLLEENKAESRQVNEVNNVNNNKAHNRFFNKVSNMLKSIKVFISNKKSFVSELLFGKDYLYEDELEKYKRMKHQK